MPRTTRLPARIQIGLVGLVCLAGMVCLAGCRGRPRSAFEIPVSKKKGKTGIWQLVLNSGTYRVVGRADGATIQYRDRYFEIRNFPSFGGHINPQETTLLGGGIEVKIADGVALVDTKKDVHMISFRRIPPGGTAIYENEEWSVARPESG